MDSGSYGCSKEARRDQPGLQEQRNPPPDRGGEGRGLERRSEGGTGDPSRRSEPGEQKPKDRLSSTCRGAWGQAGQELGRRANVAGQLVTHSAGLEPDRPGSDPGSAASSCDTGSAP